MIKDIEECAAKLDEMADRAGEVAGIQAAAGLKHDCSVQYWSGYGVACRKAAALVRKLKDDLA